MDCVFCRIVRGELPAEKVAETERTLAIMDIGPIRPGHVLVLPKAHHETLLEVPEELVLALAAETQRVARAAVRGTGAEGFNLLQNNHACAGQAVPHVHWHVIPRRTGDGVKFNWKPGTPEEGELARLAGKIRAALA